MSFRFSSGTMDSMAGVFAPPKKYRMGSGGGKAKETKAGGTMLGIAVAYMLPKAASSTAGARPSAQAKHAFGGGTQVRMSGRAVMTAERTSRYVPEAVVRITGRQHGGGHVLANFAYISRLGHGERKELGLETSEGEVLRDGREMQELAKEWHEWEMDGDARRKGATSLSMILSMPSGTDPERLKGAALDFARDEFANRQWVASLHVDRDHPHVHVTIARRDHDGRRFHPNRDDLFRYRQRFAEKLRDRGIEANATPARARGIDPKHEPIAAVKMRGKGLVPRIDKSRADRSRRLREQGIADPAHAALVVRQAAVRETYKRSIAELSASPSLADQAVAQSLERFVAAMPAPEPNSARAVREKLEERSGAGIERSAPAADREGAEAPRSAEETTARLKALRDRMARPGPGATVSDDRAVRRPSPPPAGPSDRLQALMEKAKRRSDTPDGEKNECDVSDRLRALMEEASKAIGPVDTSRADKIFRQVKDHDRAQQERDRTRDKDGPRR